VHPHSSILNLYSSEQDTSLTYTPWLGFITGANDGLAFIARNLFDNFQGPSGDSNSSTTDEAPPALGAANAAPEVEEAESSTLSSIATTSTTQEEPRPSAATPSAVDVSPPSSDQPKVAQQNGWHYWDWVRPRAVVPVRKHSASLMAAATPSITRSPAMSTPVTRLTEKSSY